MLCAIWYHLYNLKNVKNIHEGVRLLVKPATPLKVTLLRGCFSRFLNYKNGTKSCKASHMLADIILAKNYFRKFWKITYEEMIKL